MKRFCNEKDINPRVIWFYQNIVYKINGGVQQENRLSSIVIKTDPYERRYRNFEENRNKKEKVEMKDLLKL